MTPETDHELSRVVDDLYQRRRLSRLIHMRNTIRIREKAMADVKAKVTAELAELLSELGLDEVTHDGLLLQRFTSHTSRLDRKLLLRHVSPNILDSCTVAKEFSVIKVSDITEREVNDEDRPD